ncbi:unnamed protein product [Lasius platythorax]|uniref:Uncharacterized protein n=1 Tax=Lasius platythorax TaxID=488582 RepID=A0AAV2NET5_9HYME
MIQHDQWGKRKRKIYFSQKTKDRKNSLKNKLKARNAGHGPEEHALKAAKTDTGTAWKTPVLSKAFLNELPNKTFI